VSYDDCPDIPPPPPLLLPRVRLDKGASEVLRALASGDPARVAEAVGFQRESFRAGAGCYPEEMTEVCPECSDEFCPLWLPLRADIADPHDAERATAARLALERAHDVSDVPCTVCGGGGCDFIFCYAT
jgi:hypothetical protein